MNEGKPTKAKWWSRAGGGDAAPPEGDYELRRPQDASAVDGPEPALPEGDFELRSPQDVPPRSDSPSENGPGDSREFGDSGSSGDFELGHPAEAPTAVAERPKPLHDPDPYSTPPYGEPGPWAPAPPVQHPVTTPAHGTPAATQPHGATPAPTPVPHSGATPSEPGAPAHPAPAPAPAAGAPAQPA
ncbi:MAG: protease, partial [Streptomyces sp.]|nr:protease [Streptomyces sp.]